MAAITTVGTVGSGYRRSATAQATTGQTDWIDVPEWAKRMTIAINVTAVAGNTPLFDFKILEADPVLRDDGTSNDFGDWDGITQITGASDIRIDVAQGSTVDDTGAEYSINRSPAGRLLGLKTTLDRTTGDETYTYTCHVHFHK